MRYILLAALAQALGAQGKAFTQRIAVDPDTPTLEILARPNYNATICPEGNKYQVALAAPNGTWYKSGPQEGYCGELSMYEFEDSLHLLPLTPSDLALSPDIPNPVLAKVSVELIGGTVLSGTVTLGTIVTVGAIATAAAATWLGIKALYTAVDRLISRQDAASILGPEPLQLDAWTNYADENGGSFDRRASDETMIIIDLDNSSEIEQEDQENASGVGNSENAVFQACGDLIVLDSGAGGCCSATLMTADGSVKDGNYIGMADSSVTLADNACDSAASRRRKA